MASPATPKRKRSLKHILMFVLSLSVGAFGVFYSRQYIETQINFYKAQLDKTEPMVSVIVPTRKLIRGETVIQEDLRLREIPEQYADTNSVSEADLAIALGQRVDFDVDAGRPLLWAHLEGGMSPTFSGQLLEGLRALTVRVDEINSISGFLQPDDRVDLLLSHDKTGDREIFPLIEKLNVIATGEQTMVDKNGNNSTRSFSTITVQVSPENAQRITLAQSIGQITAVLRNPDDESPLNGETMDVNALLGIAPPVIKPPTKRKRAPAAPRIEFIVGGS